MKKGEVDKQDFRVLIEKYLDGNATLEELKLLINYYESYQQGYDWVEELGSEDVVRNRVLINILDVLKNKDVENIKVIPFYQRKLTKYAATAVIIFGLGYFFKDTIFNTPVKPTPIIVNSSAIKPGTDRATLTLEDGSVLVLEKGSTVQTQKANSNGEKIVYKSGESNIAKVVYNYLTIPRGGQFNIVLSDGTEVWLNSETQLKYPVNFVKGQIREVELVYGEAYFDVSPSTKHGGSKFKVLNKLQEVEVLGTEFNIKAYKDETNIYTTLVEGKVALNNGSIIQNLKPNQQSNLDVKNGTVQIKEVDVYEQVSWKDGVFSFRGKPLKEIMKVLSRWYDVDIIFEKTELESLEFIGSLDKDQNIEEILTIMKSLTINNYEIKDKIIILK
jgi:transmembrane sensor